MSSVAQTLQEVSRLLDAVPGIEVLRNGIDGHSAVLEITSQDAASAHTVQGLCEAANVALEPPLRLRDPDFAADIVRSFLVTINTEAFDSIAFGNLQLLGIHLVWHLHRAGRLTEAHANELLRQWNGALVGA